MSKDLKETYNRIAADWFKDHSQDSWWVEGTDRFISLLSSGASVLDVGCGAGVKSKYLVDKGLTVTGVDLSEKMIEIAKGLVPQADFSVTDIGDSLHFSQQFDGIFAQAVLLHIPKKEIVKVLAHLKDVLKPGGYFYIAVKGPKAGQPEEQIVTENDYGYDYHRFFSFYSLEEMSGYLEKLGMSVVYKTVNRVGKTDWVQLIAQK